MCKVPLPCREHADFSTILGIVVIAVALILFVQPPAFVSLDAPSQIDNAPQAVVKAEPNPHIITDSKYIAEVFAGKHGTMLAQGEVGSAPGTTKITVEEGD